MARIVLVADDSPTIQKKALGILKGEGFEVETVSNGVAAIKRLAVLRPVVILADVSMPGRDGYEVCDFVKKSAELSQVPVLLVASDMEPYDEARGADVRADGIIKKPFEAQDLIAIVVKFAQQFEAETPTTTAAPIVEPAAPEPAPEYAFSNESPEDMPTVTQPPPPDFSKATGGVAFADSHLEEAPQFTTETHAAEREVSYSMEQPVEEIRPEQGPLTDYAGAFSTPEHPSAPLEETPFVAEELPATSSYPPPAPHATATETPTFIEGEEAATPEPVFIEEPAAPSPEPAKHDAGFRTMIFRAPLEIAEPVWKDETIPAPPAPESAGPTAVQPQLEVEAPSASPEFPAEQQPEPPHVAPSVTATSLDSFSLDDAAAGQVHFVSGAHGVGSVEGAHSAPAEEASATEFAPAEPALEASHTEAVPPEPVLETAYTELPPPEPVAETAYTELAPPDAVPETAYTELPPPEPAAETAYTELTAPEPVPEAAYPEPTPSEPMAEAAYAEIAIPGALPDTAPLEPQGEAAAPPPAYDWGLIYTVVHKVVVRMSPPPVPMEVVEEMARRLAEEIAMEISSESSEPQA